MAADPVDFEAMAAEKNRCADMQRLLGGSSLKIAFQQAGAQLWLATSLWAFFSQLFLKSSENMFFELAQYFTPWEAHLPVYDFFWICMAQPFQRRQTWA
jgi:hypothetical protein